MIFGLLLTVNFLIIVKGTVKPENLKIGDVIAYMSQGTTVTHRITRISIGMLLFVGLPLLAFIVYDILRRQNNINREKGKKREMEAELSRLRSITAKGNLLSGEYRKSSEQ